MLRLLIAACLTLFTSSAFAQSLEPIRVAKGNTLTSSPQDQPMRIELPKGVKYVGAHRWILYDVADCELHLFVEADEKKVIKRLYWLQFEGYVASKPELSYKLPTTEPITIDGMDFYVRPRFGSSAEVPKAGSESERIELLLKAKGFTLPAETMNARFIHYFGKDLRRELMFIYIEDLATSGSSVSQLTTGGVLQPHWTEISRSLVQRARAAISIKSLSRP